MKYNTGDVVRYRLKQGLFEVTGAYTDKAAYDYTITNDECDTERYVLERDLIFVCSISDRQDLDY